MTARTALALLTALAALTACKARLVDDEATSGTPSAPSTPLPTVPVDDPSPGDDDGHGDEWNPGRYGRMPGAGEEGGEKEPDAPPVVDEPPVMMRSTKGDLVWKRARAVENDLMQALALEKDEVCNEVGAFTCVDRVHLAPLGGNEPFESGQYRPAPSPTATTAVAQERVVVSACRARVAKDTASAPVVFTALDLDGDPLDASDPASVLAADATTDALYRRFLARDPVEAEREAARALLTDDEGGHTAPADFALALCIAVGSSAENFFY